MAAYDDMLAARDQIASRIKEITASANPNYSEDGVSYSKADYLAMLNQQLRDVQKNLQLLGGPFLYRSRGRP